MQEMINAYEEMLRLEESSPREAGEQTLEGVILDNVEEMNTVVADPPVVDPPLD